MHELDVRLYDFKFSTAMKVIEKYYEEYFENLREERDWDLYCQIYQPILYGHIKDIKSFKDFKDKVHPKQSVSQPTVDYSNVSDEEIEKMLNSFKE